MDLPDLGISVAVCNPRGPYVAERCSRSSEFRVPYPKLRAHSVIIELTFNPPLPVDPSKRRSYNELRQFSGKMFDVRNAEVEGPVPFRSTFCKSLLAS